jgi:hypothetical protein
MTKQQERPLDDVSSAPESGTVCDDTSGNKPSDRNNRVSETDTVDESKQAKDDPSHAGEEP